MHQLPTVLSTKLHISVSAHLWVASEPPAHHSTVLALVSHLPRKSMSPQLLVGGMHPNPCCGLIMPQVRSNAPQSASCRALFSHHAAWVSSTHVPMKSRPPH